MFLGKESLVFCCPEKTREEEEKDEVNPSYQGADHLLAETPKRPCAVKVGNASLVSVSLCLPTYEDKVNLHMFTTTNITCVQTLTTFRQLFFKSKAINLYCCQVLSVQCIKSYTSICTSALLLVLWNSFIVSKDKLIIIHSFFRYF